MSIDFGGVAGGIGKGLMMGSQFVAQRNDAKKQQDYRDEMLGMQQQTHGAKMKQFGWEEDEKKRQDTIQGIYTEAFNSPDFADDWERSEYFATQALPHFKPHELEEIRTKNEQLRQRFGERSLAWAMSTGDIGGFQKIIDKHSPGAKGVIDGKKLIVTMPDGKKNEFDWHGAVLGYGLTQAQEKAERAEKLALENQRTKAQINKMWSDSEKSRASTTKLGTSGSGASSEPKLLGGFKHSGEQLTAIRDGISETGLRIMGPDGKLIDTVPREDAATRIQYHLSNIAEANPGISYADAVDAARNFTEAENGGDTKGGNYAPVYDIDPATGQLVVSIKTSRGDNLRYPTQAAKLDPGKIMDAQDRWADSLISSGYHHIILKDVFNDPNPIKEENKRNLFLEGLKNPQARAAIEQKYPGIYEKSDAPQ